MKPKNLTIKVLPEKLAVARLDPAQRTMPYWAVGHSLTAGLFTSEETTIICSESEVPKEISHEPGWIALRVEGVLDFGLIGVLSELSTVMANAGISIFALSTFSTDYILIKEHKRSKAIQALKDAGYTVL